MKPFAKDPEIIFSDNHLLAVVKPAMVPTQGPSSLEEWMKECLKKETGKTSIFLHPIHRLDKSVGGIVLFARSSKALSRLNEAMRERKIVKTYHALVEGNVPHEEGTLQHYLKHGDYRAEIVSSEKQGGKRALLIYKLLEKTSCYSLLEINLVTGRYHQIRAQLAAIRCPILGDRKYGSTVPYHSPGIALHHARMSFIHPVTKEPLNFISEGVSLCGLFSKK